MLNLKPSQLQNIQTYSSTSLLSQLFAYQLIHKAVVFLDPLETQDPVQSLILISHICSVGLTTMQVCVSQCADTQQLTVQETSQSKGTRQMAGS